MQIIALTGAARAGKTHVVKLLAEHSYNAGQMPVFVSFAGALKRASAEAGFPKDTHPKQYRAYCQEFGAEKRAEDPDYWVKLTMEEIARIALLEQESIARGDKYWERVVLIDDVRYENEIKAITKMDGSFLHVYAGDRLPVPHARFRRHESEKLSKRIDRTQNDFDKLAKIFIDEGDAEPSVFWVENSGTPSALRSMMAKFAKFFIGTHTALVAETKEEHEDSKKSGLKETKETLSQSEMDDFLTDLNDLFDNMNDQQRPDEDDGWELDTENEDDDDS